MGRNQYGEFKTNDEVFVENSSYARHNLKIVFFAKSFCRTSALFADFPQFGSGNQ